MFMNSITINSYFSVQKTAQASHQTMQENVAYGAHEDKERMEMTSNTAYATHHLSQRNHPPDSSGAENLPDPYEYIAH